MRKALRDIIPSMFHRRLVLLTAAGLAALTALVVQTFYLTTARHESLLADASSVLVERRWTPAVRGRILDRKDRVLALDRPSFAISVDFSVLTGRWQSLSAKTLARRLQGSDWADLPADRREILTEDMHRRLDAQVESMWGRVATLSGIAREDLTADIDRIIARVDRAHRSVTDARRVSLLKDIAESGRPVTPTDRDAVDTRASAPIREQRAPHIVVDALSDEVGFALMRFDSEEIVLGITPDGEPVTIDAFPGLEVVDTSQRRYPFDDIVINIDRAHLPGPLRADGSQSITVRGVGSAVIGDVRRGAQAEDINERQTFLQSDAPRARAARTTSGFDRGRYLPADLVGQRGLERTHEHRLRGLRGVSERDRITGDESSSAADPGRDLRSSIDVMLQARIQAAFSPELGLTRIQPWHGLDDDQLGTTRNGAAVVIDIETGEIIAMVSTPTPADHNAAIAVENTAWQPDPWINRAIAAPYPPGSIAKALILPEARRRGVLPLGTGVVCTGHLLPDKPDVYRCWIYKQYNLTHSPTGDPVMPSQAIAVSCNIFFYELGRRLQAEGVADIYHDFGLGEPFNLGIGPEWPGAVGSASTPGIHTAKLPPTDGILLAIGQGPVSWTPLHAADAYATLARGGVRVPPRLLRDASPPPVRVLNLDPKAVEETLEGLRLSLAQGGTGHSIRFGEQREPIFDLPEVDLWGKTGTATAPPILHDPDGDGPQRPITVRSGDHAWFVVLAGPKGQRPRYAAAAIIEYAGSGGKVAGPIMNQILHALADEGYLPGGNPDTTSPGTTSPSSTIAGETPR